MRIREWLEGILAAGLSVRIIFFTAVGVLLLAAVVTYFVGGRSAFAAVAAMVGGGAWIAFEVFGVSRNAAWGCVALFGVAGGAAYLALAVAISVRERIGRRRLERAERARRLQYALPDRENSYVRARLNTALKAEEGIRGEERAERKYKREIDLRYARKLLSEVKEKPLSKAERLEVEDMSRVLALYKEKEAWTAADLRAVNDTCSYLLKLSAKYSV